MKVQHTKIWEETANAVLKGRFIVPKAYIRKERSQINNLKYHLKNLEK